MSWLGKFFGADLYIDSDDPFVVDSAKTALEEAFYPPQTEEGDTHVL